MRVGALGAKRGKFRRISRVELDFSGLPFHVCQNRGKRSRNTKALYSAKAHGKVTGSLAYQDSCEPFTPSYTWPLWHDQMPEWYNVWDQTHQILKRLYADLEPSKPKMNKTKWEDDALVRLM